MNPPLCGHEQQSLVLGRRCRQRAANAPIAITQVAATKKSNRFAWDLNSAEEFRERAKSDMRILSHSLRSGGLCRSGSALRPPGCGRPRPAHRREGRKFAKDGLDHMLRESAGHAESAASMRLEPKTLALGIHRFDHAIGEKHDLIAGLERN